MSFFGFLGKVLTGAATGLVTGGPVGAIAGGVLGAAGSSGGGVRSAAVLPQFPMRAPPTSLGFAGTGPGYGGGVPVFGPPRGTGIGFVSGNTAVGIGSFQGGGAVGPGGVIPRGYHLNRSTYETRGGGTSRWGGAGLQLHPKGTVLVKSRRMNVGNARALRRAIRRARGFEKLARRVLHLTHPKRTPRFGGFRRARKR